MQIKTESQVQTFAVQDRATHRYSRFNTKNTDAKTCFNRRSESALPSHSL